MSKLNNKERYQELAEKWLKGTITEKEQIEFNRWYNTDQDKEINIDYVSSDQELSQRIRKKIDSEIKAPVKRGMVSWVSAAAAILLAVISITIYMNSNSSNKGAKLELSQNEIGPGVEKAILQLADGSTVLLDNSVSEILPQQGTSNLLRLQDGVVYSEIEGEQEKASVLFNTLFTPAGSQYQVTLADGTKVWLNSGSSLRFPTSFHGKERIVELIGEAYFDVAKNAAMPFKVKASGAEVQVLGTSFNVMAYKDESYINTTLIEGSVKLASSKDYAILEPGQKGVIYNDEEQIHVSTTDISDATSWKNGLFSFSGESVESVMRKISRWYDVEIIYKGEVTDKDFSGTISRHKNLSEVLKMLELTGLVTFQVKERSVVVMP